MREPAIKVLQENCDALGGWLFDAALPLWAAKGFDGPGGGFVETIDMTGAPTRAHRRGRVQPRQVYCFAEAGRRGWAGDWRTPVESGLAYMDRVYLQEQGFFAALADADGLALDPSFDLYNQAFALLAFAHSADAIPARRAEMAKRSDALLDVLTGFYRHPVVGFEEGNPVRLPLGANPHMHFFEACLSSEVTEGFDKARWAGLADEIAGLCMARFIDPESGALREFFAHDWTPFPGQKGRLVEPGHLFEWAWLLLRWSERRGDAQAFGTAQRLFSIGEQHGVDGVRGVTIMGLLDDFSVVDPVARLWSQTEWLKSAIRLATLTEGEERRAYLASAERACGALNLFLDAPVGGLWRDKQTQDGMFVDEPAPASTFYHIVCAVFELQDCLKRL